jgi:hypothetical protein
MKRSNKKLYRARDYEACCACCVHGKAAPDGSGVLCSLRGVMRDTSLCKKYEYDPVKREPQRSPALPVFDPEQFTL